APTTTISLTLRPTKPAASSSCRSGPLFSANRYSMVRFFPSIQPSLFSSCRNASARTALPEAVLVSRKPMRRTFPVCCASADEQSPKSMAQRVRTVRFFFICFSLSRSTRHSTLDTRPFSFDQPIRSGEHLRRNRKPDLLCRFQIYHQLELRGLFHWQVSRLGSLQDSVHVVCDAPVAVREVRVVGHE